MRISRIIFSVTSLVSLAASFPVAAQLDEGFETVMDLAPPATNGPILAGGWFGALRSEPLGPVGIFQGVPPNGMGTGGPFSAQEGPANSYIGASFANAGSFTEDDVISTWIISPELELNNGDLLTFYTRTVQNSTFPDRLDVRLSTNGASVNVGGNAFTVGDFTASLMTINPNLEQGGYPETWTQFEVEISGLVEPVQGRFAFHYFVPDLAVNGNAIGIDTLTFTGSKNCLIGDVNQDDAVNLSDVSPFVNLIAAGQFQCEADINGDQVVNLQDVAPFVALLSGS